MIRLVTRKGSQETGDDSGARLIEALAYLDAALHVMSGVVQDLTNVVEKMQAASKAISQHIGTDKPNDTN